MRTFTIHSKKHGDFIILIDDEDFLEITKYKWTVNRQRSGKFRVICSCRPNRRPEGFMYLHQFIMKTRYIDHIDRNPLNNQKSNLRVCSQRENSKNQSKPKNNTSGYKGVIYDNRKDNLKKRWVAQIKVEYKHVHIGRYLTKEEAAEAYNKAAIKHFGEFAHLNEIIKNN